MTVVFSAASDDYIIMANDCAITNTHADGRTSFDTQGKHFLKDGIGCVTMWGIRTPIYAYLLQKDWNPANQNIDDLAHIVHRYLIENFAPLEHDDKIASTGFHVGGFTAEGKPRLYHSFWNPPGEANAGTNKGAYTLECHYPIARGEINFLFNGRNDLAIRPIYALIEEMKIGKAPKFSYDPIGMCRFAHFVMRFAAEITPEVGPPFLIHILAKNRNIKTVALNQMAPSEDKNFERELRALGLYSSL